MNSEHDPRDPGPEDTGVDDMPQPPSTDRQGHDDSQAGSLFTPTSLSAPASNVAPDVAPDAAPNAVEDTATASGTLDMKTHEVVRTAPARATTVAEGDLEDKNVVEGYTLLDRIGSGGCSTVFSAESKAGGKVVAIKILRLGLAGSRRQVLRFVQEAQAVQRVEHPSIVPIHETGYLHDGRPFLVMELIEGESLTEILYRRGRMTPREALTILEPVCEALAQTHDADIVHRDIKASNIMISGAADRPRVRLLDFGIAKLLSSEGNAALETSMGRVVGTPQSMAPEQILGHPVTGRTDIYALGVLLFRILTGRHPYSSPDPQVIVQMHMTAPPPKTSEFAATSRAIDDVIARAMAKDPEHRYQSARDLASALRQAIRSEITSVQITSPAVAIYVDARLPAHLELEESVLDDLMIALDMAERELREHRYRIPLQTSEAVLGVRLVTGEGDALEAAQRAAVADAEYILRLIKDVTGPRIHFNMCVHSDEAIALPGALGHGSMSGAITDIGSWAPVAPQEGVWISANIEIDIGERVL